jgi:excisionase family DNA binding protein
VEVTECPGLLGELERLKAILWSRMVTVACGTTMSLPQAEAVLLTIPQVAKRLAIAEGRTYELARQGKLPTVKVGKYIRVEPAALDEWIGRHRDMPLDAKLYTTYSSGIHDRHRPSKTSQALGLDPSRPGSAARGHRKHCGPVGTRGDSDPRVDSASDNVVGK